MRIRTSLCVAIVSILLVRTVALAQPLEAKIAEVKFSAVPFADVIAQLQETSAQNLSVNWKALEARGINRATAVTVDLNDVTLEQALADICASLDRDKKAGITFKDDDGVVCISTGEDLAKRDKAEPLPARGNEPAAQQTDEMLNRQMPEINFNQIAVRDAIEFIHDVAQLQIEVNWDALEKAGIKNTSPTTIRVKNLSLRRTLRLLLDDVGGDREKLDYVVDGDHILVSTREDLLKK